MMKRKVQVLFLTFGLLYSQNAHIQLIHNVADVVGVSFPVVVDSVDIYLSTDGGGTWTLMVPDFKFRQATPYTAVPANSNTVIAGIAPGNSLGPGDILINYNVPPLAPGSYNIAIVAGTIDFFSSQVNVNLYYYFNSRNTAQNPSDFDFIFFHGAPDVGNTDVYLARDRSPTLSAYERDLNIGQYQYSPGYFSVSPDNLIALDTTPSDPNQILPIAYYIPSTNLLGQAGVVFVSGYASIPDPAKSLGLYLALPNGNVLPLSPQEIRRLQVVHNAADPALQQVDIYVGGVNPPPDLQLDFREATSTFFVEGNTGTTFPLIFTARGQTTPLATVNVSLPPAGTNYAIFAQGVTNPTQFAANPNGVSTGFGLVTISNVVGWAPSGSFRTLAFHGVTDAPAVDVYSGGSPLVTNLQYKQYGSVITTPANAPVELEIRPAGQSTPLATYSISTLQARDGEGSIVFASGFLSPANNQNGPAFGLYIVYPNGDVEPLGLSSGMISQSSPQVMGVSGNPSPTGEWQVCIRAIKAEEAAYTLTNTTGQVIKAGTWSLPGAGTWVFTLSGENMPSGIYFLRVGESLYRLVRL
ncbi:MAG: hypothetical protein RMJ66_01065 [Bacteroidia bacterium]|nr:DUF4397 domain-containing protein [Bacteroidia bacterium]MDW8133633.1 hypothetical protein [Bacteroidia bacterium]